MLQACTLHRAPKYGQDDDTADAKLFFGREQLTAKLVNRLQDNESLLAIVGASGSGKSSLARTGLASALRKGKVTSNGGTPPDNQADWRVHFITPTAHPLEALAVELTREGESATTAENFSENMAQDPRSLDLFLASQSPKRHTLLVLDQFEELFTLCQDEFERVAFIDNLLTTLDQGKADTTLIITLRADFYAHLAQYMEREADHS